MPMKLAVKNMLTMALLESLRVRSALKERRTNERRPPWDL